MRSLILLILGISAASAGGYYYRDAIPTPYRFWESSRIVELQHEILDRLKLPSVDIAVLETDTTLLPAATDVEPTTSDVTPVVEPVAATNSMPLPAKSTGVELAPVKVAPVSQTILATESMPLTTEVVELTMVEEASVSAPALVTDSITPTAAVAELTMVDETPVSTPVPVVPVTDVITSTAEVVESAMVDEAPVVSSPAQVTDSLASTAAVAELTMVDEAPVSAHVLATDSKAPKAALAELTIVDESPVSVPASITDSMTSMAEVVEPVLVDEAPVAETVLATDSNTPKAAVAELTIVDESSVSEPAPVTDSPTSTSKVLELAMVEETPVSSPMQVTNTASSTVHELEAPAKPEVTPVPTLAIVADVEESIEVDESLVAELVEQVEQEARVYVEDLSGLQKDNVEVKQADHFVSGNQVLELLGDDTFVEFAAPLRSKPIIQALAARPRSEKSKLGADFDTKAVKELVLIQATSTENLQPLITNDTAAQYTDVIGVQNTDEPVMIVRQANAVMPVLPELVRAKKIETTKSKDDSRPQQSKSPQITIAELLKDEAPAKDGSIYYVRTVKKDDQQGIWGIIVDGLTENFANGIAISRDEKVDTYQVNIPRLSDDALPDNSSSFLGKLIDRKTRECFVYNFVEKKIGQNPDLIYPGQELLIINFEAEELIDIYTHFVENS